MVKKYSYEFIYKYPMNYKDLPRHLLKFFKPLDLKTLSKNIITTGHSWRNIHLNDVIDSEGLLWFRERNIFLRETVFLFKATKNIQGPFHIDNGHSEFAINLVISGHGKMQWADNIVGNRIDSILNNSKYVKYENVTDFKLTDTWEGDFGIVRILTPHRIVTSDEDRYCISIRSEPKMGINTFDESVTSIFNN
jgi:hypothetical protein